MCDEDILALAEVLAERDEGFIQITQATGDIKADLAFLEKLAAVAQRPILHNAVAPARKDPEVHRRPLRWVEKCRDQGLPDLRPVRHGPRRLRLHARALEPLRRLPGLAGRHHRHQGGEDREDGGPGAARGADRRGRGGRPAPAGHPGRRRRQPQGPRHPGRAQRQTDLQQYVGRIGRRHRRGRGQAPHRGHARPVPRGRPEGRVPRPRQGLQRRVHGRDDERARPTPSPACPTAAPTPSSSPAAPTPPTS